MIDNRCDCDSDRFICGVDAAESGREKERESDVCVSMCVHVCLFMCVCVYVCLFACARMWCVCGARLRAICAHKITHKTQHALWITGPPVVVKHSHAHAHAHK